MKRALLTGMILAMAASPARGQSVPQKINYQGMLTDVLGNPLTTGTYALEFNIYSDRAATESLVWGPIFFDGGADPGHHASVFVMDGRFNVFLGPMDTDGDPVSDAFAGPGNERFLEVAVHFSTGTLRLTPWQQILSAPYALQAGNADQATDADHADNADQATRASALGTTRDVLSLTADDGGVRLNDPAGGVARATMEVSTGTGMITTYAPNGSENVHLGALTGNLNNGWIGVMNENGGERASIWIGGVNGSSFFELRGHNGNLNVMGGTAYDVWDHGSVVVFDAAGARRAGMYVAMNGAGQILTFGPNGSRNVDIQSAYGDNRGSIYVQDENNTSKAGIFVDWNGYGQVTGDYKSFIVDHPKQAGAKIMYACIEGPEVAMYHRGVATLVNGRATVDLPEHFAVLASPDTLTVQLTPRSAASKGVAATVLRPDRLEIVELMNGTGSYEVCYRVEAVRIGYENFQPVLSPEEAAKRLPPEMLGKPAPAPAAPAKAK